MTENYARFFKERIYDKFSQSVSESFIFDTILNAPSASDASDEIILDVHKAVRDALDAVFNAIDMDEKNCLDCKHCYIEDIWFEPMCRKGEIIERDKDDFVCGICEQFEPMTDEVTR